MKKLLIILLLICSVSTAETRPDWLQLKNNPFLTPEQFGAKGDGDTNDAPAFQALFDYLDATPNKNAFIIPDKVYKIKYQVVGTGNYNILGLHNAKSYAVRDTGGRLVGEAGMESIFKFTGVGSSAPTLGTSIRNVAFSGPADNAILFTCDGAPGGPVNINECNFVGFASAAIKIEGSVSSLYTLNVTGNHFHSSRYAIHGEYCGGLRFIGNTSRWGGKLFLDRLYGTYDISDNNVEGDASDSAGGTAGQERVFHIISMSTNGRIGPNYWEGAVHFTNERDYGIVVETAPEFVNSSRGKSSLRLEQQYMTGDIYLRVLVDGVRVDVSDTARNSFQITAVNTYQGSRFGWSNLIFESPYVGDRTKSAYTVVRDVADVLPGFYMGSKPPLVLSPGLATNTYRVPSGPFATSTMEITPFGLATCTTILGLASAQRVVYNVATFSAGAELGEDGAVSICFLMKGHDYQKDYAWACHQNDTFETVLASGVITLGQPGWNAVMLVAPNPARNTIKEYLWSIYTPADATDRGFTLSPAVTYAQTRYHPFTFYLPHQGF